MPAPALSAVHAVAAWLMQRWRHPRNARQTWRIGLAWFAATVAFEFVFGFLRGKGWSELLSAHTVADGNLWPLVLLALAVSPYLCRPAGGRAHEPNRR